MPEEYTPRELGILLADIAKDVSHIKEQTTATNGRVRKLEMWKQFLLGAWAVLSVATPIAWYFIGQMIMGFKSDIASQITEAIRINNEQFFEKQ